MVSQSDVKLQLSKGHVKYMNMKTFQGNECEYTDESSIVKKM